MILANVGYFILCGLVLFMRCSAVKKKWWKSAVFAVSAFVAIWVIIDVFQLFSGGVKSPFRDFKQHRLMVFFNLSILAGGVACAVLAAVNLKKKIVKKLLNYHRFCWVPMHFYR